LNSLTSLWTPYAGTVRIKQQIVCVGTFAIVDLWSVRNNGHIPYMSLGQWGGSVVGNDAVVVAQRIKHEGMAVTCILIQPTDADLQVARRAVGAKVVGVGTCPGMLTRSLCLEDADGSRRWVVSRHVRPSGDLEIHGAAILYLDYYPELRGFLNRATRQVRAGHSCVFVNLSDISSIAGVPRLPFTPTVLQASIGTVRPSKEAFRLCSQLRERTGAEYVFGTRGYHGAVLDTPAGRWSSKCTVGAKVGVLGSGALFSAEVIAGLSRGLKGQELLELVVRNTAASLQANEGYSIGGDKRIG